MRPPQQSDVSVTDGAGISPLISEAGEARSRRIALTVSIKDSDAAAIESVREADGLASASAALRRLIQDGLMYRRIRDQIMEHEETAPR